MSPPIAVWKTSLPGRRAAGAAARPGAADLPAAGAGCSRRRRGDLLRHGQAGRLTEQPDIGCRQPAVIVFFAVGDPQPAAVSAFPFGPERLGAGDLRHDRGVGARLGAQGERQPRAQGHEPLLRQIHRGRDRRRRSSGGWLCGASAGASAGVGEGAAAVGEAATRRSGRSLRGRSLRRQPNRRRCRQSRRPRQRLAATQYHQRQHHADNENPAKPVRSIFQDSFPIPSRTITSITSSRITLHAPRHSYRSASIGFSRAARVAG